MEQSLKSFCIEHTKERDSSHGAEHMFKVWENAKQIMLEMEIKDIQIMNLVLAVSLFHDIADHKYLQGEEHKKMMIEMNEFLCKYFDQDSVKSILFIIDNISFSKEKRGKIPWSQFTNTELLVRNIVSDADKLEAIGKIGIERCIEYIKAKQLNDKVISTNLIYQYVIEHCNEKLFLISTDYMRTKSGKEKAKILHKEMIDIISNFS